MKIVMDKRIPGLQEALSIKMPEVRVSAIEGSEIRREDVKDADILFVRTRTRCNRELLEGSRVSLVGTATIGTDHIDTDWCTQQGIRVVNAPGCNAPAVAQYVASTLDAAGFDPARHTLGVIGKGHIGSLVVQLYRAAGTRVLVCDPPRREAGFDDEHYLDLDRILHQCDAVTLHVPYTAKGRWPTRHLLAGPLPSNLKIIVNASRGEVLNPEIISRDRKFIVDTWPFEDSPSNCSKDAAEDLIEKAFIATPHIAGYSRQGKQRATNAMLEAMGLEADSPLPSGFMPGVTLESAIASFNPLPLSESLKRNPAAFESLRSSHLRNEPGYE